MCLAYGCCVVIGLIPVNRDFEPATSGVTIYVDVGAVHTDIVVPIETPIIDWREKFPANDFAANTRRYEYYAIGWGDRGFYVETPAWSDLKLTTAANAMLIPSESVLHVSVATPLRTKDVYPITISNSQYQALCQYMDESVQHGADGRGQKIDFSYHRFDAFYRANGTYHALNTCNCWAANALEAAGIRVPAFSPLPGTVLWYLPDLEGP